MWESLNLKFSKYPARMAVAQKMFELGLRISEDGKNTQIYTEKALMTQITTVMWSLT